MEDEDADFLDDVIDFGDGRQYHVQAEMEAEEAAQGMLQGNETFPDTEVPSTDAAPVTKENRFRDDIDRSWPRNQTGLSPRTPIDLEKPSIPETASPKGSLPSLSPEKQHRALFNERSNRLEPLNRPFASSSTRGSINGVRQEERASNGGFCIDNTLRHLIHGKVVQVLQKPSLPKMPEQPRAWTGTLSKPLPANGRPPDMGPPRPQPPNAWQRAPSTTAPRRSSISIPEHTMQLQSAQMPAPLEHAAGPSVHSRRPSVATTVLGSIADAGESPKSTTMEAVAIDSEEVVKATMLSAAERAKKRRMEEEAEREAQKERARKKAAELEVKIESEKAKARPAEQAAKSPVEVRVQIH
jgi:serine/arginine repetitive matrix protein 2